MQFFFLITFNELRVEVSGTQSMELSSSRLLLFGALLTRGLLFRLLRIFRLRRLEVFKLGLDHLNASGFLRSLFPHGSFRGPQFQLNLITAVLGSSSLVLTQLQYENVHVRIVPSFLANFDPARMHRVRFLRVSSLHTNRSGRIWPFAVVFCADRTLLFAHHEVGRPLASRVLEVTSDDREPAGVLFPLDVPFFQGVDAFRQFQRGL